jgi:transposase
MEVALAGGRRVRFLMGRRRGLRGEAGGGAGAQRVLTLPASVRILLATGPVDMRKSIEGLMALVRTSWGEDVSSGYLFAFVSRRGDRVKTLTFSRGGFVLYSERLEVGRFRLPPVDAEAQSVPLDGIDVAKVKRQPAWMPRGARGPEHVTRVMTHPVGCYSWGLRVLPLDHHCPWREEAEELKERLTWLEGKMAALERHVFGKRMEQMPTVASELHGETARQESKAARDEAAKKKRRERAAQKKQQSPTREFATPSPQRQGTARPAAART